MWKFKSLSKQRMPGAMSGWEIKPLFQLNTFPLCGDICQLLLVSLAGTSVLCSKTDRDSQTFF